MGAGLGRLAVVEVGLASAVAWARGTAVGRVGARWGRRAVVASLRTVVVVGGGGAVFVPAEVWMRFARAVSAVAFVLGIC